MEFQIYTGESIAESLTALGLPSAFIDKTITCTTIKYHFNLENITKLPKVKKVAELLSATCHEPIKVLSSQIGHFCLEFTRKEREFPNFMCWHKHLANKPAGEILFGIDDNGQPITRNIMKTKSIMIAGSSGGGKSVLLSNIICSLACYSKPEELSMTLIDLKRCEFGMYKNLCHLNHDVITDYTSALSMLNNIRQVIDTRYTQMEQMGIRQATTDKFPIVCVIIDEYAELASRGNKQELDNAVASIAATGRACNVFLIIATQHAVGSIISNVIKSNMQTKIGLRTTNVAQSICAIGTRDCVDLLGYGDSFIHFDGQAELKRVQVCNLTDNDIYGITANCKPRVWSNQPALNQVTPKIAPTSHKTSWLDKILGKLGFDRSRPQRMRNSGISAPKSQVPYNIDEQNFFDCVDDDEEN